MYIGDTFKKDFFCYRCNKKNYLKGDIKIIMDDKKYKCETCDIAFKYKSQFEVHKISEKHRNGNEKKIHKCDKCFYETPNKTNFKLHLLNYHCSKEERKKNFPFFCEVCNNGHCTSNKYDIHCETEKHKKNLAYYEQKIMAEKES